MMGHDEHAEEGMKAKPDDALAQEYWEYWYL
jgi:hypothetical protein